MKEGKIFNELQLFGLFLIQILIINFTFTGNYIFFFPINPFKSFCLQRWCLCSPAPELCRFMLRRLGKSLCRESSGSWIDERELFARIRDTRPGYIRPSFRTSTHFCSWLSVICSRRRDGYDIDDKLTLSYSFRHRNNSSSLHKYKHKKTHKI